MCRVLLDKLIGLQLVKKFPTFYGTRKFITALTSLRHPSLSWSSPIQSINQHRISCRAIQILSIHLRLGLPTGLLPSGFPSKNLYNPLSSPTRAACPARIILIDFITDHLAPRYAISSIPPLHRPSQIQIFFSTTYSQTPSASFLPQCQRQCFTPMQIYWQTYRFVYPNF